MAYPESKISGGLQNISFSSVSSLLKTSLLLVVKQLPSYINDVERLPANIKDRLLNLMSKRGLITDDNLCKVIHSQLKVLDLSESDVSDHALECLSRCRSLRKIDLNSSKESRTVITSVGVEQLARSCFHLQVVYLRRCVNLTDSGVLALAQCCPQLRELNIGGCTLITDAALQALGEKSKFLKNINFSKTSVSDEGVSSLASGVCKHTLKEIHMDGCKKLTDDAVEAVCLFCPQISILLFHGCPLMTDRSRQAMEDMATENNSRIHQVTWTIY